MKKLYMLVLAAILICLQLFSAGAVFAAPSADVTDISVIITNTLPDTIYEGCEPFTVNLNFVNKSGVTLSDLIVSIDQENSSFDFEGDQTLNLGMLRIDTPIPKTVRLTYNGKGNELVFTLNYKKGGDYVDTQSVYIKNAVPTADALKRIPKLNVVSGTSIPVLSAGTSSILSFPVKNSGNYTAKNVVATLEMEDKTKAPLVFDKLNISQSVDTINVNETKSISFDFAVLSGAPDGIYELKLNYQFVNSYNSSFTSSETVYIKIQNDDGIPRLTVDSIEMQPDSASKDGNVNLKINIKNSSNIAAKDVKVKLKGLKSGGFTTSSNSTDVKYLAGIAGNSTGTVTYSLLAPDSAAAGSNELTVTMAYRDAISSASYSEDAQIFIPAGGIGDGRPGLSIDKIQTPKGGVAVNRDFTIGFDLGNTGTGSARNIKAWLTSDKELVSKSLSNILIDRIDKGASKKVEFKLFATDDAVTRNYPVAINVEYEDIFGVKNTVTQYVGIFVENSGGKSVPRIIIDKYAFEPAEVKAGEDFSLNVSFLNTSRSTGVSNIKVTFTSDDGVFTPVESSNTFFIESIGMKKNVERSLAIHTKPDADAKPYSLTVNFEYEDDKGTAYTSKETVSIPVKQNPRLVTGDLSLPPQSFTGQPLQLYLDFYNMGKSVLYNLLVKAEGDFTGQELSYYVGNFESGRSDSFDVSIIPNKAGQLKGNIVFTFEDAAGKSSEIKKEFSLTVTEMKPEMMAPPDGKTVMANGGMQPGQGGRAPLKILIFIVPAIILIAAVVILIVILKKRKKRKELSLDE